MSDVKDDLVAAVVITEPLILGVDMCFVTGKNP